MKRALAIALPFCLAFTCGTGARAFGESKGEGRAWGPLIAGQTAPRGSLAWPSVCSVRHAMCVRAAPGTSASITLSSLEAADRAWDAITGPLGAPPPEGALGEPWQAYLVDGIDGGDEALFEERDPISRLDRAASFALVDRTTMPGCALDLAMARAVAGGSMWRGAPATDRGSARAEIESLAQLATSCASPDGDALQAFQDAPERGLVDPSSIAFDRGAARFFEWVDSTFGAHVGGVLVGLWALAPTHTPPQASRWAGEPTGFDVFRVSLGAREQAGSALDDVFVRFAVARALASPPPRPAWSLPWPTHARRLASPRPVTPSGASYVVVDHAGAPPGSKLRMEATWEDYGRLRWVVLKLNDDGRLMSEIAVTSLDHGTIASMTVDNLDTINRICIVAVNVGSTEHRFDPDEEDCEPHGWLLTLDGE